jgi:hypothetical protein
LHTDGTATEAGHHLRRGVEDDTDRLATDPWRAPAPQDIDRLTGLLGEFWVAVLSSGLLPSETTPGVGKV